MWMQLDLVWRACIEQAWLAYCQGCVPIGAVITDALGRILTRERNHLYEPRSLGPRYLAGLPLAHAEINAILAADFSILDAYTCTLYTTTEPCPLCCGALVMANLRHVCYASRDPWAGSAAHLATNPYTASKNIRVEGPPDARLEAVLIALQTAFHLQDLARRAPSSDPFNNSLIVRAASICPGGAALGKKIFMEDTLTLLRSAACPSSVVIDKLDQLLPKDVSAGCAPNSRIPSYSR